MLFLRQEKQLVEVQRKMKEWALLEGELGGALVSWDKEEGRLTATC